jgi:hypothetical protein
MYDQDEINEAEAIAGDKRCPGCSLRYPRTLDWFCPICGLCETCCKCKFEEAAV